MKKRKWQGDAMKSCRKHAGVECEERGCCRRCGWNPVEAAQRRVILRKQGLRTSAALGKYLSLQGRQKA